MALWLLQIRDLIILRVESSIISIDSNTIDNIIRSERSLPRIDPWGPPALTEYSCEILPSRTTQNHLLMIKEEIKPNAWPEIPYDLSLSRRPACQTLSKALDLSSATARVAPALLKALSNSIDSVRRSAFDWPKIILKIRKKTAFL